MHCIMFSALLPVTHNKQIKLYDKMYIFALFF